MNRKRPAFGPVIFYAITGTFGAYLTFAAVQGEYGLFRRIQVEADAAQLRVERDRLAADLVVIENRTRRLSDEFLDLDLLDQQAREVLGYVRSDEVVLR
ncbi:MULTISPECIES: FtsB family cell division protein [Pararhodobacter]|uniref:Septum formation initiator n=1 Tax=Pararhodobacter aggregans TaxID=404875 RepID=A0A2T7UWP0_9RHOB|nr:MULTISPECIES: septum formation initiator family protein [Pararhodobacter]PTX04661.1 cell division protein FtsB [Pararhodobacter aggregans]PVE49001.1 septum formation initiator precursor [Pararhodobacter aggregans]